MLVSGLIVLAGGAAFGQASASTDQRDDSSRTQQLLAGIPPQPLPTTSDTLGSLVPHSNQVDALPPPVELIVAQGVPLRVILKKAVHVKRVGQPIQAYLTDSIYAFDRVVVPKGSEVDGRIVKLASPAKLKRIAAYLNADFSPHRAVQVQFDTLVVPGCGPMILRSKAGPDTGLVLQLETNPQNQGAMHRARGFLSRQWHDAVGQIKPSALWRHAKTFAYSEWPYHRQKLMAGTVFVVELEQPIDFGSATVPAAELGAMGQLPAINSEAFARLTTPLDSATSHVGASVAAMLTRPIFTADKKLLLPVGTELQGMIVRVRPARRLHRNGQLHFTLTRVQMPSSTSKSVEMALEGIEVPKSSHVQVDSEGATHIASDARSRLLSSALSVAIANSTLDSDSGHAGATARSENRPLGGASGYKLIGFAVSFAAASPTLSRVMGFWGAGQSVYFHFIARGQNLVLPKNTPMQLSFGEPRRHNNP